jgi:hypothetical protein
VPSHVSLYRLPLLSSSDLPHGLVSFLAFPPFEDIGCECKRYKHARWTHQWSEQSDELNLGTSPLESFYALLLSYTGYIPFSLVPFPFHLAPAQTLT